MARKSNDAWLDLTAQMAEDSLRYAREAEARGDHAGAQRHRDEMDRSIDSATEMYGKKWYQKK